MSNTLDKPVLATFFDLCFINIKKLTFLALIVVGLGATQRTAHAQFSAPVQSPLQVGGTLHRYAVASTYFNGLYYVAYTGQNGYLYIASSTSLTFSSATAITTPSGNIQAIGSPTLVTFPGQLYLAYIIGNNTLYVIHSADGATWSTPTYIPMPSGVVPDGTPNLANFNGTTLMLGVHDHTAQRIVVCSIPTSTLSPSCSQPTSGSTYGPGLVTAFGVLYTFFESSNSSHSLYYYTAYIAPDGTLSAFTLNTVTGNDQTSAQPSAVLLGNSQLLVGFRSNDGSAKFLGKTYNISSGTWSTHFGTNVSINGAPNLLSPTANETINFFVSNNSPYYLNTMYEVN